MIYIQAIIDNFWSLTVESTYLGLLELTWPTGLRKILVQYRKPFWASKGNCFNMVRPRMVCFALGYCQWVQCKIFDECSFHISNIRDVKYLELYADSFDTTKINTRNLKGFFSHYINVIYYILLFGKQSCHKHDICGNGKKAPIPGEAVCIMTETGQTV